MSQLAAQAPTMNACFTGTPDLTPYTARPNIIPLDERNKPIEILKGVARQLALASEAMDFFEPNRINEDTFNRVPWHASMGVNAPYPAQFASAPGRA